MELKSVLSAKSLLPLVVIIIFILGGFYLLKGGNNANNAPSPTPKLSVKMGRSVTPGRALPVLVAEQKGFFDKYNLSIKSEPLIRGYQEAVIAGRLDIMNDGGASFLAAAVQGAAVKMVGVTLQADPYYMVGSGDLKFENIKKVAINRLGGEDYYMTMNALRLMDVDTSKVEFVISGDYAGKYPLLLQKKVDIAGLQPTADYLKVLSEFEKDGMKILFNVTDDPNAYYPLGIVTREDYIKTNPEAVKSVMLALKEAIEYARTNKGEAVKILMDEYQLNEENAQFIYDNFLSSIKNVDMKPKIDHIKLLLEDMKVEIPDAPKYDATKFIDTSYTP